VEGPSVNSVESWPSPENLGFLLLDSQKNLDFYWIHKKILTFIGFTKKSWLLLAFIGFHAKILGSRYFGVPGITKNKKSSTFFHFVAGSGDETMDESGWLSSRLKMGDGAGKDGNYGKI
jgi:hypothetical protein